MTQPTQRTEARVAARLAPGAPLRIAALGMHRSGTSYLAGSLQRAGLDLGQVSEWNEHNRAGNRESDAVVALNDAVLQANGGSWDRPPRRVTWSPEQLAAARRIARRHAAPWGFKDPRTLLTLAGWLRAVPGLRFIGIFRHPLAVTRSLQARAEYGGHRMETAHCLALWSRYNRELLARHETDPFPVLCFDWEWDRLEAAQESACRDLGLDPPPPEERFVMPELRSAPPEDPTGLPDEVVSIHQRLLAIAGDGNHG